MYRKFLSCVLAFLIIGVTGAKPTYAGSDSNKESRFAEKVKENISKLGVGEAARVEVKLKDKTKLKGYIIEAGDESFTVVDEKSGVPTVVPYPQVKAAKGNNLSQNTVFIIALAGLVAFVAIVLISGRGRG